jgi:hypothetical protein
VLSVTLQQFVAVLDERYQQRGLCDRSNTALCSTNL